MLRRYFQLLRVQLRASSLLAMQYRYDFVVDGLISMFWTATALVPLFVVFHGRRGVAGWSFAEAMVVTGWFIVVQGILEGAINPGLSTVVEHIRKGTLDFILLKPADAQFLVSTSRFAFWKFTSLISGGAIFVYAFHALHRLPTLSGVLASLALLVASTWVLYSLWILTVSAAFYVVKIDNLTYLFSSIFDAARWPASIFRGVLSLMFTFVIPLALMTTYPAEALLGRLSSVTLGCSLGGALVFGVLSRRLWLRSIGRYTSASS